MLTMDQIHDIRNRFYEKGENISQIAEALHLDWRTVRKKKGIVPDTKLLTYSK